MSDKFIEYDIPVPNPALAEWLAGPECRAAVSTIAQRIFALYASSLPELTRNLKSQAYWDVELRDDRWYGVVGNRAVSYRGQKGKPYPRYIEGGTRRMPGQHQLQNAVAAVTGQIAGGGLAVPGLRYNPKGRGSKLQGPGGTFIRNPLAPPKAKKGGE